MSRCQLLKNVDTLSIVFYVIHIVGKRESYKCTEMLILAYEILNYLYHVSSGGRQYSEWLEHRL